MKVPQLKKKPELKSCHNTTWEDNYSWIHQDNILEVLKDSSKLLPDVRKYLEEENNFTEHNLKDTKKCQKILFDEIKGRIKLDDESLKFKDKEYEYWTKTTAVGNYSIKLRKKIGSSAVEEFWNGDVEKEKLKTEYFEASKKRVIRDLVKSKFIKLFNEISFKFSFSPPPLFITTKALLSKRSTKGFEIKKIVSINLYYSFLT